MSVQSWYKWIIISIYNIFIYVQLDLIQGPIATDFIATHTIAQEDRTVAPGPTAVIKGSSWCLLKLKKSKITCTL